MQTKQSKFPIGWIFAIMAAIAVGVLTFFSSNFQYLGQKVGMSFLFAVLVALIPLAVVGGLVWAKKVSMPFNFHKAAFIESCLFIVYFVVVAICIVMINHFFVVIGKRDTIKKEVTEQVNQIDDMFRSYDENVNRRTMAYRLFLNQVERDKDLNLEAYKAEKLDTYSKEDLVINFKAEIDYDSTVYQEKKDWKRDLLHKTSGLGLITLMPRIQEINANLEATSKSLEELDKKSEKGLNGAHWTYSLPASKRIVRNFENTDDESLSIWSLIVAILAGLIMLLPYIATERDGRHKGLFWELSHTRETLSQDNDIVTGI